MRRVPTASERSVHHGGGCWPVLHVTNEELRRHVPVWWQRALRSSSDCLPSGEPAGAIEPRRRSTASR